MAAQDTNKAKLPSVSTSEPGKGIEWSMLRIITMTTLFAMVFGICIMAIASYRSISNLRDAQKLHNLETIARVFQGKLETYDIRNIHQLLERELLPNGFSRLTIVDRYGMRHGDVGQENDDDADLLYDIEAENGAYLGTLSAWNGPDRFLNHIFYSFLSSRLAEFFVIFILFATIIRKRLTSQLIMPLNALRDYLAEGHIDSERGYEAYSFRSLPELSEIANVYEQTLMRFSAVEIEKRRALADEINAKNARLFQALILERALESSKMGVVYQADEQENDFSTTGISLPIEFLEVLKKIKEFRTSDLKNAMSAAGFTVSENNMSHDVSPETEADKNRILCQTPSGRSWIIHAIRFFPRGWACLCIDVTEQIEKEKRSTQREKMESLGVLSSGIAHDINNVLAIVSGSLELNQEADGNQAIDQALLAVERGKGLVKQLLAFAHAKQPHMEYISTSELFAELEKILPATLGPSIPATLKSNTKKRIKCDLDLLQMTMINLCVNARDAILSEQSEGQVHIQCSELSPTEAMIYGYQQDDQLIAIDVEDSGPGIPSHVKERIFEPFYTTKPIGKGTGLGLSSSYANLRDLGGNLSCESNPDGGAKFRIILPATDKTTTQPVTKRLDVVSPENKRLLVVDDEKGLCDILCQYLGKCGFTATPCYSASEAFSLLKDKANEPFDLVVTDLQLRDGKGTKIHEYLRQHGTTKLLLISGNATSENLEDIYFDQNAGVLEKPFGLKDLAARVTLLLHKSNSDKHPTKQEVNASLERCF